MKRSLVSMENLRWFVWLAVSLFIGVSIALLQAFILKKILIVGQTNRLWLITFSAYLRWILIGLLIFFAIQKEVVYGIISALGVLASWQIAILLPGMRRLLNDTRSNE